MVTKQENIKCWIVSVPKVKDVDYQLYVDAVQDYWAHAMTGTVRTTPYPLMALKFESEERAKKYAKPNKGAKVWKLIISGEAFLDDSK